jgi:transcriptional regulator with XRE-family HTH domain
VENPVKTIRKENNLTQEAVASLANVTTQVVTRSEAGTLSEIPVTILRTLHSLSGTSTMSIVSDYEEWIEESLSKVKLDESIEGYIHDTDEFRHWVHFTCELNGIPDTIHSLAGLLKIHPYVLEKWSKGRMKEVPVQLVERIKQIRRLQNASDR